MVVSEVDCAGEPVLLVGAGRMAVEYARVLTSLSSRPVVVGRSAESAARFTSETGLDVVTGGLERWLDRRPAEIPETAIVAVNVSDLADATTALISHGIRRILVEKPAALNADQLDDLNRCASAHRAEVFVAYNRRFYASTRFAQQICEEDGGVTSLHFEFTEWSNRVAATNHPREVLNQWFLANSTHVVDLAFFLAGRPAELSSYVAGGLDWHPQASGFVGAGVTESGVPFSYHANWESAGRWGVELRTAHRRLILCPLEELHVHARDSVATSKIEINDSSDRRYKPGLYHQVCDLLSADHSGVLPTIKEHCDMTRGVYERIVCPHGPQSRSHTISTHSTLADVA